MRGAQIRTLPGCVARLTPAASTAYQALARWPHEATHGPADSEEPRGDTDDSDRRGADLPRPAPHAEAPEDRSDPGARQGPLHRRGRGHARGRRELRRRGQVRLGAVGRGGAARMCADGVMCGGAPWVVVENFEAKLETFRRHDINVCCGGSHFELA